MGFLAYQNIALEVIFPLVKAVLILCTCEIFRIQVTVDILLPLQVETSDHARLKVEYAMNNYFEVCNWHSCCANCVVCVTMVIYICIIV